jgi:hypothetical protein
MLGDLFNFLGWLIWIATILFALAAFEAELYKRRKYKRTIAGETPAAGAIRWILNIGNRPEESLYCQASCTAPPREVMESIKALVTFRRPCLQFPLNQHWWQLNSCDYAQGRISAILKYPETLSNLVPADIMIEIVWVFGKNKQGEIVVRLDWYNLVPWETRYKHNVLLSMVAYTEERLRRLNSEALPASRTVPAPGGSKAAAFLPAQEQLALLPDHTRESLFWPSPQDYNESVQNPDSAFLDEDLCKSAVETNSLGMPKAVSGSFASVYHLKGPQRDWAVRCFLFPLKDQQLRYAILSRHLAIASTKAIVEFSFVENGIRAGKKIFPILKMEWVEGLSLNNYVENNLANRSKLAALRLAFREMVSDLRQSRIAHGDLQHGNILVREDELVLVDYDGMFVPELARFHSAELGHPNYQHPKRAGKHFGLFLDNFAGWLIDTSLLCLAEDSFLWDQFSGGDECLLFRRCDLLSPQDSPLFSYLSRHSSRQVRSATEHFLSLLDIELEEIPFLTPEPEAKSSDAGRGGP